MIPSTGIGKLSGTMFSSQSISMPSLGNGKVVWWTPRDDTRPSVTPTIFIFWPPSISESSFKLEIFKIEISAWESKRKVEIWSAVEKHSNLIHQFSCSVAPTVFLVLTTAVILIVIVVTPEIVIGSSWSIAAVLSTTIKPKELPILIGSCYLYDKFRKDLLRSLEATRCQNCFDYVVTSWFPTRFDHGVYGHLIDFVYGHSLMDICWF